MVQHKISKILFKSRLHNGTKFYDKYISTKNRLNYFDDDGSDVLPKILARKWNNTKDHEAYSNCDFVFFNDYIKDRRIQRTYSGRKRKATGYVLITGSPYRDD